MSEDLSRAEIADGEANEEGVEGYDMDHSEFGVNDKVLNDVSSDERSTVNSSVDSQIVRVSWAYWRVTHPVWYVAHGNIN